MRPLAAALSALACLFVLSAGPAAADPFCCECKDGKKHLLDESGTALATAKCSLKCKRPTVPQKGVCEAPAAPAASAAPAAAAGAGVVALYKSDDCSGDASRLDKSEPQLAEGFRSYQVESGAASAHAKAQFGGAAVQPISGSLCVSPGWSIGSIRIGK